MSFSVIGKSDLRIGLVVDRIIRTCRHPETAERLALNTISGQPNQYTVRYLSLLMKLSIFWKASKQTQMHFPSYSPVTVTEHKTTNNARAMRDIMRRARDTKRYQSGLGCFVDAIILSAASYSSYWKCRD